MNPDELRTLLKQAGKPVQPAVDPVPVIRQRARKVIWRRAIAGVATGAAAVVAVAGLYGPARSVGLPPEPARPSTATDPGPLPEAIQEKLLPLRLGSLTKVANSDLQEAGADHNGDLLVRPGDVIRIAYTCGVDTPANASIQALVTTSNHAWVQPNQPIMIPLPNCLHGTSQIVEAPIPLKWPERTVQIFLLLPDEHSWQTYAAAGIYRAGCELIHGPAGNLMIDPESGCI